MNPNETLRMIRMEVADVVEVIDRNGGLPNPEETAKSLATLFQALDGWLSKGGVLPRRWNPECQRLARKTPSIDCL